MNKILISPGYGAGWSTWNSNPNPEVRKFILTYPPLIEYVEQGGTFSEAETRIKYEPDNETRILTALHPVLRQFLEDLQEKFPEADYFYLGGARDLEVFEVDGPFRIEEYDGFESVTVASDLISLP